MKFRATFAILASALMGCGDDFDLIDRTYVPAAPSVDDGSSDCAIEQVTHTKLPAPAPFGSTVQTCTNCDTNSCNAFGAPCDVYDTFCETNGEPGICSACCIDSEIGPLGALRCAKIIEPVGQ